MVNELYPNEMKPKWKSNRSSAAISSGLVDTFHVKGETHVAHISDSNDFFTALTS